MRSYQSKSAAGLLPVVAADIRLIVGADILFVLGADILFVVAAGLLLIAADGSSSFSQDFDTHRVRHKIRVRQRLHFIAWQSNYQVIHRRSLSPDSN